MPRINWKKHYPHSLRHALQLTKEYGKQRRLSVERIADQLGKSSDSLYKYLSDASMPVNQLIAFESVCGAPIVTQYLAHSQGYLLVPMPTGRKAEHLELSELNIFANEALIALARCYEGSAEVEQTRDRLMKLIEELAYQREEVNHQRQPDLGDLAMRNGEEVIR
ncbi:hypothetical protein [Agarivorans gilvus]|uniref:XRE family transcriptional regulator n=1 Tax=Agarivorans gilvus TaxID=680279 RepID=A0ABQ1HYM5_9ALTE|nr:hypothetical protein [Agarivorans gilvus]GGA95928.1 hypothetical protein GCM10007414_05990 [Agarivorans gilvus]